MMISKKAIVYLRALGHALDPVVQIGKGGISPALVKQTNEQLLAHELIKVRVATEAPLDRKEAATALAAETGALLAQVLGRTFLLYKAPPAKKKDGKARKPKIVLPEATKAEKRAAKKAVAEDAATRGDDAHDDEPSREAEESEEDA